MTAPPVVIGDTRLSPDQRLTLRIALTHFLFSLQAYPDSFGEPLKRAYSAHISEILDLMFDPN